MSVVGVTAGCLIVSSEVELRWDAGWVEEATVELVGTDGSCDTIDLHVPAGGAISTRAARLSRIAGPRLRLGEERWSVVAAGPGDDVRWRLRVPELVPGDQLRLSFTRTRPAGAAYRWAPGEDGPGYTGLKVDPDAELTVVGHPSVDGTGWLFATDPPPSLVVFVHPPEPVPSIVSVTEQRGLSWVEARDRLAGIVRVPDDWEPEAVAGDAMLSRGFGTAAGFAATVVSLTADGPDEVRAAWPVPPGVATPRADHGPATLVAGTEVCGWAPGPDAVFDGVTAMPRGDCVWPSATWSGTVRTEREVRLVLPPGDPRYGLAPGQGSHAVVTERIQSVQAGLWSGRLPAGARDVVVVGGLARDGFVVHASGAPTVVTYTLDDAPTYGEGVPRPGEDLALTVVGPDLTVRWEGRAWALERVGDVVVLPDRAALVRALDARFRAASVVQPAVPGSVRRAEGWAEVAEARQGVLDVVRVTDEPLGDPLWPRRLSRVRRSGWASEVEAAIWLEGSLHQLGWTAEVVLVRPTSLGAGPSASAAGYTSALVRVERDGEIRWVDPGCVMCGPFEVRASRSGASALAASVAETPPPPVGRLEVDAEARRQKVVLEGPPALALREALRSIPVADRAAAIASRMGGAGARLLAATGVEEAGAAIQLVVVDHETLLDPLSLGAIGVFDGESFVARWVGERVWTREASLDGAVFEAPGLRWTLAPGDGGRVVETLRLDGEVRAEDVRVWADLRTLALRPDDAREPPGDGPGASAGGAP